MSIAALNRLAQNLAELATVPSRAAKGAAKRIDTLVREEFATGHDPYDNAWTPLLPQTVRRKGGDRRILIRTGALRDQTGAMAVAGAGIEILSLEYGQYHQTGTSRMVARPLLPNERGLPDAWEEAIEAEIDKAFRGTR